MGKRNALPCALALALITIGNTTHSATLEEVIVTATKRAESLQDIPVTVTAFSAETIQEAGINNASDLAILTPALNISTNQSPFNSRLTIRGVGTAQTDPALEPSVGLFVDGIFFGRSGLGMSDLVDIERIEVLQGPQGTLYGRNTNAGAISIVTKAPNFEEFESFIEASVGNYSMYRLTAAASGPIGDSVAYRISGSTHERDGFYDNSAGDDLNDADDWNLQGKLQWDVSDALSILLSASHMERNTTCCAADVIQSDVVNNALAAQGFRPDRNDPYDYDVQPDIDNGFDMESDLVSLTVNYAGNWGEIVAITAWNDYEYSVTQDPDRSQLDVLRVIDDNFSGDSFAQELRFTSTAGDNVDYMVGLYYYQQTTARGDNKPFVIVGEDLIPVASQLDLPLPLPVSVIVAEGDNLVANGELETETLAIFSQATLHVGDAWHFTGGLRYSDETKDIDLFSQTNSTALSNSLVGFSFLDTVSTPIDAQLDRSTDNVDWLLRVSRDIGDDSMIFASAATGTKSGGFNSVNGQPEDREFDDEETLTFELGVKATLLEQRLRVNASAFYTEIEEYQFQQQLDTGIGTFVSNAAEIETSGIDLQVEALPLPNLTLSAGVLYMHDYEVTAGPNEGDALPWTADFSGNLAATLVFPLGDGGIYWRTDYSYMDDHATNAAPGEQLRPSDFDDRTRLNSRLGWRNDHWNISIWGKNLTDDDYASQTVNTFILTGMDAYFLAEPLTFGATVRYDI